MISTPQGQTIAQQMTANNDTSSPLATLAGTAASSAAPAPAAATPPASVDNAPAPGDDALGGNELGGQVPTYRSDFANKLARALDQPANQVPLKANGKPVPGGWAKSLIGAAQGVLAGVQDVSTSKALPGQGALSGFAEAAQNRQARIAEQQKQAALQKQKDAENQREDARLAMEQRKQQFDMTRDNLQMQHQQKLAYQVGVVQPMVERGAKNLAELEDPKSGHPVPIEARDVPYSTITKNVIDGKWNHHDFTAIPTSVEPVGQDENGEPINRVLYTVVKSGGEFTPSNDEIDFLNQNHATEKPITYGQKFQFGEWNHVHQNAEDTWSATQARNKQLTDAKIIDADEAAKLEAVNFGPDWTNALAQAHGDVFAARAAILANPKLAAKYPSLEKDIVAAYPGFDKLEDIHEQELAKAREKKAEEQENLTGIPMTQEMQNNIAALPADKKAVLLGAAKGDSTLASTLYSIALNDGSIDVDKIFPNRVYKGGTQMPIANAMGVIKELTPGFNEDTYRQMHKLYLSLTDPNSKRGQTISQFNNLMKHAGELSQTLSEAQANAGPEIWNTALNKMTSRGWGQQLSTIAPVQNALKGEYDLLIAAGYKPDQELVKSMDDAMSVGSTPGQINAALKKMIALGSYRLQSADEDYASLSGRHIPNLVRPDALQAARVLDIPKTDAQTWSRLQSLATGPRSVFSQGIPGATGVGGDRVPAPHRFAPAPEGQVALTDGKNVYYFPTANAAAAQKKYPNLKPVMAQ